MGPVVPKSRVCNDNMRSPTEELPFGNWALRTITFPSKDRRKVESIVEVPIQMTDSNAQAKSYINRTFWVVILAA